MAPQVPLKADPEEDLTRTRGFCCETEAVQVASVLNASGDPCSDFYDYVCSRSAGPDATYVSPMFRVLTKWRLVQLLRTQSRRSEAGALLTFLRQAVPANAPDVTSQAAVANLTSAIAATARSALAATELRQIVRFFVEASVKYGLPSVVSFAALPSSSSHSPSSTLKLTRNMNCGPTPVYWNMTAAAAVGAFNKIWNATVTVEQVVDFGKVLCKLSGSNGSTKVTVVTVDTPVLPLTDHEWGEILKEFVLPAYPNVSSVYQVQEEGLSDVLTVIADAANHPVSAAYIVTCMALNTYEVMRPLMRKSTVLSYPPSCEQLGVCEVEEVFKAEAISTQETDDYIRDYFSHVVDTVSTEALISLTPGLFSRKDRAAVIRCLKRMKLMLPKEIAGCDVVVPKFDPKNSFAENLLLARAYAYDLRKARNARNIPSAKDLFKPEVSRREDIVFVPSNLYMLLKVDASPQDTVHIPTIGVGMATEVWSFLLERTTWSQETSTIIEARLRCFGNGDHSSRSGNGRWLRAFSTALGLASIIHPERQEGWRNSYRVGRTTFTEGQLAYLLWVYNRCESPAKVMPEEDINLAVQNSASFAEAFECPDDSPILSKKSCLRPNLPKKA
ncbi:hypothetical protein V5799_031467 [Amblyomma americanum]|uniref:Uncharacterized protein n=1 Tax=Amblyomma americanum TaxID=6943 RepID=A0AAQ4EK56_AMBAM